MWRRSIWAARAARRPMPGCGLCRPPGVATRNAARGARPAPRPRLVHNVEDFLGVGGGGDALVAADGCGHRGVLGGAQVCRRGARRPQLVVVRRRRRPSVVERPLRPRQQQRTLVGHWHRAVQGVGQRRRGVEVVRRRGGVAGVIAHVRTRPAAAAACRRRRRGEWRALHSVVPCPWRGIVPCTMRQGGSRVSGCRAQNASRQLWGSTASRPPCLGRHSTLLSHSPFSQAAGTALLRAGGAASLPRCPAASPGAASRLRERAASDAAGGESHAALQSASGANDNDSLKLGWGAERAEERGETAWCQ